MDPHLSTGHHGVDRHRAAETSLLAPLMSDPICPPQFLRGPAVSSIQREDRSQTGLVLGPVPLHMSCVFFCGVGLIHWVCTYAGAYAWAPLSSKCLRERFSLLGAYAGCLRRVLSPTLVTSGDSKIEELYNPQVVARCDRVTSGSCLQGVYSFATDGQIDFVSSRSNYSVEAAAHKQRTTSRKQEAAAAAAAAAKQ